MLSFVVFLQLCDPVVPHSRGHKMCVIFCLLISQNNYDVSTCVTNEAHTDTDKDFDIK